MGDERTFRANASLSQVFLTPKIATPLTRCPPPPLCPHNSPDTKRSYFVRQHEPLPNLGLPLFLDNDDQATHNHQLPAVPPRHSTSVSSLFLEKNFEDFPAAHSSQVSSFSSICPLDDPSCLLGRYFLRNNENSEPEGADSRIQTNSQELDAAAATRFRLQIKSDESSRGALSNNTYFSPVSPGY